LSTANGRAGVARVDGEHELGGPDLIEQAVVRTMLNGGTVYAVPGDEMPDRSAIAALFRY
jgi:hypothetical protein